MRPPLFPFRPCSCAGGQKVGPAHFAGHERLRVAIARLGRIVNARRLEAACPTCRRPRRDRHPKSCGRRSCASTLNTDRAPAPARSHRSARDPGNDTGCNGGPRGTTAAQNQRQCKMPNAKCTNSLPVHFALCFSHSALVHLCIAHSVIGAFCAIVHCAFCIIAFTVPGP